MELAPTWVVDRHSDHIVLATSYYAVTITHVCQDPQQSRAGFQVLYDDVGLAAVDCFGRADEHVEFASLDIGLEQIETRQVKRIETKGVDPFSSRDRLADVDTWVQSEAADAGSLRIVEDRGIHLAIELADGGPSHVGVEAIVDRDIAGASIEDAALHLEGEHIAPALHVSRPLDGHHANVRAAVNREASVAVCLPSPIQQFLADSNF